MLLSASITAHPSPLPRLRGRGNGPFLFRLCDGLCDHFRISAEPVRRLDELIALDLEDLHVSAALVIGCADLKRWHQPAEREVMDLLEALFDLLAGRLLPPIRFDRVAGRLSVKSSP